MSLGYDDIWLFDPFNQTTDLTELVSSESYTVRKYSKLGASWYGIQLKSPPSYKQLPSSSARIQIVRVSDSTVLTEVSFTTYPSSNQFRVDYDNRNPVTNAVIPNYKSTGLIQFNATDNGQEVLVTYYSTGKSVIPQNFADYIAGLTIPGDLTLTNLTVSGDIDLTGTFSRDLEILLVRDVKSSATSGGTLLTGTWNVRDLNTVEYNGISGASLSSNQITLPVGTYYVYASAPGILCDVHLIRLYNTTAAINIIYGSSEYAGQASVVSSRSLLTGVFTLANPSVLELQHNCSTFYANSGGLAALYGDSVFSQIFIKKLS